ncbi:hypothetical protein GTA08_BOTSDO02464 [Botryosphaeria dothidea]|uniref:Uncharacterized protein n=1 Tax=Botryosphaeria dothidea TaxID=55169 RepID=A0A8H4N2Z7_9PEZI|nr:hypothetical protein GTA08_BOTSDO02464 [Botryosphaeria dothidea]
MKLTYLVGAASLASALALPAPSPDLDSDILDALLAAPAPAILGPEPDDYNVSAPAYSANSATAVVHDTVDPDSTVQKRTDTQCTPLPQGAGPVPQPDTAEAFLADGDLSSTANNAQTPDGWVLAFQNKQGSTQQAGYRGLYTMNSYSPSDCAAECAKDKYCQAFNVYFERDPSIRAGPDCADPPSTTLIKCTFYGFKISAETATNVGQYQQDFHVVIAGSNGYNKATYTPPTLDGFTSLGATPKDGAIEDPSYYLYELYNQVFDPAACAKGCLANTKGNMQRAKPGESYVTCKFFNAYVLYRDNNPVGTVCSYFKSSDITNQGTNVGQWQGKVHVTVGSSYTYKLT